MFGEGANYTWLAAGPLPQISITQPAPDVAI